MSSLGSLLLFEIPAGERPKLCYVLDLAGFFVGRAVRLVSAVVGGALSAGVANNGTKANTGDSGHFSSRVVRLTGVSIKRSLPYLYMDSDT